jgi:cation diffusion facilitator family transporter
MSCDCELEAKDGEQKSVLITLLLINAGMFVVEVVFGVLAQSTALIADALDMLADATVYGISLYAVGRSIRHKVSAARISGVFQIVLGLGVFLEVLRRFVSGSSPEPQFMIGIGVLALIANSVCLALIARHRDGEIHMRASWIFSRNDVIANLGVITAGVLVAATGSDVPDLFIGAIISAVVVVGGFRIWREAGAEQNGIVEAH